MRDPRLPAWVNAGEGAYGVAVADAHAFIYRRLALLDQGLMKAGRHHQGGREASHDSGRSRGGAAE